VAELADYLDLTVGQARQQFRDLKHRSPVSSGRQVAFLPVETLLCLAASFLINYRRFGGSTAHFTYIYRVLLNAARAEGIGADWHWTNVFVA
jgi:hypothetical protein